MISPAKNDIRVTRGATIDELYYLTIDGVPWDLTGYAAIWNWKITNSKVLLPDLTDGDGITLGGTAGTIEVYYSDEDTRAALWNSACYTLFLEDPNGDRESIMYGKVIIEGRC